MIPRAEFNKKLNEFMLEMYAAGDQPVEHEVFRTSEQQQIYWKIGREFVDGKWVEKGAVVTKLDGIIKRSAHQLGLAVDIYFVINGEIKYSGKELEQLLTKWHEVWQNKYGGRPMLDWDKPHFQF